MSIALSLSLSLSLYVCVCVFIHSYIIIEQRCQTATEHSELS